MLVICSVKALLYSFFWLVIYSLQADGVSWLPQSLMDKAEKEFGMQAQQQLKSWGAMSAKVTKLSEQEKLKAPKTVQLAKKIKRDIEEKKTGLIKPNTDIIT